MAKAQQIIYAVVGAGDLAVEKAANLRKVVDRERTEQVYSDFVNRGRAVSKRIGNAAPTKRAAAQTKTARSQVKAAATSVGKAVRANVGATRSAATKVAKAS